jgi:glycolate oxidase
MPEPAVAGTALPVIRGEIRTDQTTLLRYRTDLSHYAVMPRMVVFPEGEEDVRTILAYAVKNALPVTARGAGSNQSGSAVGEGIILQFGRMQKILGEEPTGVRVEPGIVWDALNAVTTMRGLRISYNPSSRAFCTIGGNVATGASGIHGLKYGGVDRAIRNLRFIDPVHGVVDTRHPLPGTLAAEITGLKERIREDDAIRALLERRRGLKSSSGYNLPSFFEHEDPGTIVAHLLVGSVGTLGIFTAIELGLVPVPSGTLLCLVFFPSLTDAAEAAPRLRVSGPSAMEMMDGFGLSLLRRDHGVRIPPESEAVLMVEYENGRLDSPRTRPLPKLHAATGIVRIRDPQLQQRLWAVRESMLLRIRRDLETADRRFLAFADDLAVPPDAVAPFIGDIRGILADEGVTAVIYGHIGEGNIHVRPLIDREGWEDRLRRLAATVFRTTLAYGGTITGEHGAGRNRSRYLREEWGDIGWRYFREIKEIFDPRGMLNPGVFFGSGEVTDHLQF